VNPLVSPPEADRILVIRLGAVGDVVRTLPAVSSLRCAYPGSHVTWLVEAGAAGVLEGQPWIDAVLVFPRHRLAEVLAGPRRRDAVRELRHFLRALRGRDFDLVLDFHAILRSAALARLSGSARRVSYAAPFAREGAWLFATDRARLAPRRASRFARNAALVRFLGVDDRAATVPMRVDARAAERMARALGTGHAPIAIHPGSSDATASKRYTEEGYAAVARALARDGLPVVVTRGPARDDEACARAVVDAAQGAARLAPPTPRLRDLAALLSVCRATLGGDTGPLHISSLVGTPVVQVLGPTDPVENAPWHGTPSRTLRARDGAISQLAPQDLVAAVRELLEATRVVDGSPP
jgi:ADP-heptose:LPS heptosyltransferase